NTRSSTMTISWRCSSKLAPNTPSACCGVVYSIFGTIPHRTKRSKGYLSHDGMLHMMFKLGLCAEKKWRRFRGLDYLSKVVNRNQIQRRC
ncbi:MAG: hypothetical protein KZQ63_17720, partial [Candidatus Thiodiazotropha sp. (ex Lucinoma aequizonata)]|nr:hypothetical protein [Candidatus Thiodiazotropha sp. (ex Lucinoma aequizonata)]